MVSATGDKQKTAHSALSTSNKIFLAGKVRLGEVWRGKARLGKAGEVW